MAWKYCNYDTGNDTTGDGTVGTPYKTIAKAVSVMAAGDSVGVMANEPVSVLIDLLVTNASYANPCHITSVNAAGVETGTDKFTLTATGGLANMFKVNGVSSYAWSIRNLVISGCAGYVFTGGTAYGWSFINLKIVSCYGIGAISFANSVQIDVEYLNCTGGDHVCEGVALYNIKISGCTATNYLLGIGGIVDGLIMHDCSAPVYGIYPIASFNLTNFILDKISLTNASNNILLYSSVTGLIAKGLISNCVGHNPVASSISTLFYVASAPIAISDVSLWNNTYFTNSTSRNATGLVVKSRITSLASDPYVDQANDNFAYKSDYVQRRYALKLGEFNNLYTLGA